MTPSPPHAPLSVRIDLSGCADKAELLDRFAAALRFPAWFGHNWDALADALCDLSWLPATACHLVLSGSSTLRTADPEAFATLLEILDDCSAYWSGTTRPFSADIDDGGRDTAPISPPPPPACGR
jgi:RNAse (barnase) inhibitor barstar